MTRAKTAKVSRIKSMHVEARHHATTLRNFGRSLAASPPPGLGLRLAIGPPTFCPGYPHRNEVLGRTSTMGEQKWLQLAIKKLEKTGEGLDAKDRRDKM